MTKFEPTVYRSGGLKSVMIIMGLVISGWGAAEIIAYGGDLFWSIFEGAILSVVVIFYLFRLSKMGAYAFESELVIRNPLRTVHVKWDQIDHFAHGRFGIILKVGAVLRSGEVVPIAGLPVSAAGLGGSTKVAFDELNARVGHISDS